MKIYVTKSSIPPFEEYCNEIKDIWDSAWMTNMGPKHQKLELMLTEYLKVKNASIFTNGHLALESAIALFDFKKGSEVITTPFTFVSTTNAIVRNGLVPVFCDIKMSDYTIDENKIEELITDKTVAIVAVHVYGHVCNIEAIDKIAKKHNLVVIYDAAHAFGVKYKGVGVGNFGDASMFSFHATKVFNTIEGGAVTYSNKEFAQKIKEMRNFGIRDDGNCMSFSGNSKMSEFQAAMGICNLKYIDKYIADRKHVYDRYMEKLRGIKGIVLPKLNSSIEYNYSYFPVLFDGFKYTRDEVIEHLAKSDIFARKYFYPSINEFYCYKKANFKCRVPNAIFASNNILTLPLFPDLKDSDIDRICSIVVNYSE